MEISNAVFQMKVIKGILVSVTGYLYTPGTKKIESELGDYQYKDFQIYMAVQLAEGYRDAITNQRFRLRKWSPLSLSYMRYKKQHHLSLKIWEATGTLKNTIHVFKKGTLIVVGFKQSDTYHKTGIKINTIARYLEYGTVKMPARPLFRPLLVYMRKHVSDYYKRYQKELKSKKVSCLYLPESDTKSSKSYKVKKSLVNHKKKGGR